MKIKNILDGEDGEITWSKPKAPGTGATIGERIEYSIAEAIRRFFDLFDEPLAEFLAIPFRLLIKVVEKSTARYTRPLLTKALQDMDKDDPLRDLYEDLLEPTGEGGLAILAGMGASAGTAGLMGFLEPFFESVRQRVYFRHPSKLYDLPTWVMMNFRGMPPDLDLKTASRRLGFRQEWLPYLLDAVRERPGLGELFESVRRGDLSESNLNGELVARGYSKEEAINLTKLVRIIPGPTDQIRMAVREAFDPETIAKFGLHEELYKVPFDTLEKVGLSEEWAKAYWAAHWELPSVQMGYEMLHRGIIDEGTLRLLLAAHDVSPTWRDPLVKISYAPYTRVDIRRMYDLGIASEEDVYKTYRDLGYDAEHARNLVSFVVAMYQDEERKASRTDIVTAYKEGVIGRDLALSMLIDVGYRKEFVEAYMIKADYELERERRKGEEEEDEEELQKERELTKADVLSGYQDGLITEGETTGLLTRIGYSGDLVDFLVAKTDFKRTQALIREEITTSKTLYINEEIELHEVHARLGKYALPATQIEELVRLWNIEKERRTERPSISKLIDFYLDGIIEEDSLHDQLERHKLNPDYIEWFIQSANIEIREREIKEEERLLKEQERIVKSRFKTDRMIDLNRLDISIQQFRVYMAELKVAVFFTDDPDVKRDIAEQLVQIKAEIARLQLSKLEYPILPTTREV